jgi:hypothetical protein
MTSAGEVFDDPVSLSLSLPTGLAMPAKKRKASPKPKNASTGGSDEKKAQYQLRVCNATQLVVVANNKEKMKAGKAMDQVQPDCLCTIPATLVFIPPVCSALFSREDCDSGEGWYGDWLGRPHRRCRHRG